MSKKVVIQIRQHLLKKQVETGVKESLTQVAEEYGHEATTLYSWEKKECKKLRFLYNYAKKNGVTIDSLIKEMY